MSSCRSNIKPRAVQFSPLFLKSNRSAGSLLQAQRWLAEYVRNRKAYGKPRWDYVAVASRNFPLLCKTRMVRWLQTCPRWKCFVTVFSDGSSSRRNYKANIRVILIDVQRHLTRLAADRHPVRLTFASRSEMSLSPPFDVCPMTTAMMIRLYEITGFRRRK